jgi:hypothetical protein
METSVASKNRDLQYTENKELSVSNSVTESHKDDKLYIINKINEMNLKCREDKLCNSKFMVDESQNLLYAVTINKMLEDSSRTLEGTNLEEIMKLYTKIINPMYIKKHLLEFEFNHITYSPIEVKTVADIKNKISVILKRYAIPQIDDEEWVMDDHYCLKKKKQFIVFKNTTLKMYQYEVKDYMRRLVKIIKQLLPDYEIDRDMLPLKKSCTRRVITITLIGIHPAIVPNGTVQTIQENRL